MKCYGTIGLLLLVVLMGCGSSIDTQETQSTPPPPSPPAKQTQGMEFETNTDTVAMEKAHLDSIASHGGRDVEIKYMVQIGAFKDPQLAAAVQTAARERYHLPVLNDFNTALGLYQIRIGFFETRENAYEFRQRMQREYPGNYKDAWVVHLKR